MRHRCKMGGRMLIFFSNCNLTKTSSTKYKYATDLAQKKLILQNALFFAERRMESDAIKYLVFSKVEHKKIAEKFTEKKYQKNLS